MNSNLLNSAISRPQPAMNPQLMSSDPSFPALDPTDFRVLHRTSHSPFQLQQQQLQQLHQQLRNNGFAGGPTSAPILNSATMQNPILHFANSVSSSSNNLTNNPNAANMLMMMNNANSNSNNNLAQLSSNYLLHQSNSNQVGSVKMWSNFNPNKDLRIKSQHPDNSHQEFQIQQEDFPALPRPQSVQNKSDSQTNLSTNTELKSSNTNLEDTNLISPNGLVNSSSGTNVSTKALNVNQNVTNTSQNVQNSQQPGKKGIIILPDGRIKNVPPNMLLDQFGIVGLLAYLRSADREKDIYTLALGTDLTALGLNLNSNENLYHSFLSPFSDASCRLQDI
ncbi:CCR4-NOT transcription complex subunit 2 isoform X4, partial [Brachionus plicatilis]